MKIGKLAGGLGVCADRGYRSLIPARAIHAVMTGDARRRGRYWVVLLVALLLAWGLFLALPPDAPVGVEILVLATLVALWLPFQVVYGRWFWDT